MCFLQLSNIFMLMMLMLQPPPWHSLDDFDNELLMQIMYMKMHFLTHIPALSPLRPSFYQMMDMMGHNVLMLSVHMFSIYQQQRARYGILMVSYM